MAEKRPLCIYSGQVKELLGTDSLPGGSGGISYSVINTNTNAIKGNGYLINASAGNVTLTLPGSPSAGDTIAAVDIYNKSTTNAITLARNGNNIEGIAEDLIFDVNGAGFILVYADSTRGWEIVSEIGSTTPMDGYVNYHGVESAGTIAFDSSTHVLSVSAITYWYKSVKFTTSFPISCDLDLTADRDHASASLTTNTLYYVYFKDSTGKLYWSPSVWNIYEMVPVATVFWNGSEGAVCPENHGHKRDIAWHIWAHTSIGCRYISGLDKTYPTAAVDGSLQIEAGSLLDEDRAISIGQQTAMRGWYKVNSETYTFANYALPYIGTLGAPVYLDTDTYSLTTFASNKYVCYWVFGTGDQDRPIAIIPSHVSAPYSQAADARTELAPSITGLNPEWKLIYRWIYSGDGQFVESTDYRRQTSIAGGVSASTTAGAVSFSPSGNVSATNVQSAIEELDTEKSATSHTHSDATTGTAGFMSATDKTKLDGVASGATAYTDSAARSAVIASSISDGDTTHAPDGNSVYDALALKAPLASPTFSGTVDVSSATLTLADNQISKDKISGFQNKNLIINGDMSISQRGTSFNSTTTPANSDDTYLLDRWTLLSDGNDIADVTQQTGGGVNGNEYFIRLDVETAQKKFGIIQIVESKNCRPIIGKTCSLSFEAKVTNATKLSDIRAMVVSWAGTADSVTSDIVNAWGNQGDNPTLVTNWTAENTASSLGVTTAWARYTIENISIDTASTKQIALFIWQNNVAANDTTGIFLEITNVQIELGSVATDFECRPYGLELMLCQRYYYAVGNTCYIGWQSGHPSDQTLFVDYYKIHPVVMRATATATCSAVVTTIQANIDDIISVSNYTNGYTFAYDIARLTSYYSYGIYGSFTFSAEL